MAAEVSVAREERGVKSWTDFANIAGSTSRNVPRLYDTSRNEEYPNIKDLGISTRDETAQKDKDILESVLGQMSDGMWENSRRMEKYWRGMTISQNETGGVELRHAHMYPEETYRWSRGRQERITTYDRSGYNGMGAREVREFFAKKIKQIFNAERKEDPSVGRWSADNKNNLSFMHDGITVSDAYSLYKRLMSR